METEKAKSKSVSFVPTLWAKIEAKAKADHGGNRSTYLRELVESDLSSNPATPTKYSPAIDKPILHLIRSNTPLIEHLYHKAYQANGGPPEDFDERLLLSRLLEQSLHLIAKHHEQDFRACTDLDLTALLQEATNNDLQTFQEQAILATDYVRRPESIAAAADHGTITQADRKKARQNAAQDEQYQTIQITKPSPAAIRKTIDADRAALKKRPARYITNQKPHAKAIDIIHTYPGAAILTDHHGNTLAISASMTTMCGHPESQFVSATQKDILHGPDTTPEQRATAHDIIAAKHGEFTITNHHADGSPYDVHVIIRRAGPYLVSLECKLHPDKHLNLDQARTAADNLAQDIKATK